MSSETNIEILKRDFIILFLSILNINSVAGVAQR
jgi:hypothetical protein